MAKKKEPTVEEKLRALYDLQLIDSRIDKIRDIRGELPLEVRDLEDEIEGLNSIGLVSSGGKISFKFKIHITKPLEKKIIIIITFTFKIFFIKYFFWSYIWHHSI